MIKVKGTEMKAKKKAKKKSLAWQFQRLRKLVFKHDAEIQELDAKMDSYNLKQERPLAQPKKIVGTCCCNCPSESQCNDASSLPDEFITYFNDCTRAMRYSSIIVDSWDEWIWNGEWIFSGEVNDATALREFQNADHVAILIR